MYKNRCEGVVEWTAGPLKFSYIWSSRKVYFVVAGLFKEISVQKFIQVILILKKFAGKNQ